MTAWRGTATFQLPTKTSASCVVPSFFREVPESICKWWAPLFDHMCPTRLCGDVLHTVDLGVCSYWAGFVFYSCVSDDIFSVPPVRDGTMRQLAVARRLNALYGEWKGSAGKEWNRDNKLVNKVTARILWNKSSHLPKVKAKGMHTRGLFYFAMWVLERHCSNFRHGRDLLASGNFVVTYFRVLRDCGSNVPDETRNFLLDCVRSSNALFQSCGGRLRPKHHAWMELTRRCNTLGNPLHYSTYRDETFNCTMVRIAEKVHARRFAIAVMNKYRILRQCMGYSF